MAPNIDGTGRKTKTQSTITFVVLCTYAEIMMPRYAREQSPVANARAVSRGMKPWDAHENRLKIKCSALTVQESIIMP